MRILFLLLMTQVAFAETVYIGKNSKGDTIRKDVISSPSSEYLNKLKVAYPELTFSTGSDTDVVMKSNDPKEDYSKANTVNEKLAVIEKVLGLN